MTRHARSSSATSHVEPEPPEQTSGLPRAYFLHLSPPEPPDVHRDRNPNRNPDDLPYRKYGLPWRKYEDHDTRPFWKDMSPRYISRWSSSHKPPGGGAGGCGSWEPPIMTTRLHHRGTLRHSQSGLLRSLEIPSQFIGMDSRYRLPRVLDECGVSLEQWDIFSKEVRYYASISVLQWIGCAMSGLGTAILYFPAFPLVLPVSTLKRAKFKGFESFRQAVQTGQVAGTLHKWNADYFEPLGLHVAIALPGSGVAGDADVSSTKMYKYREKYISRATLAFGTNNTWIPDPKEKQYRFSEGSYRWKAAKRGRIVVLPLELVPSKHRATPVQMDAIDFEEPPTPSEAEIGEVSIDLELAKKVDLERRLVDSGMEPRTARVVAYPSDGVQIDSRRSPRAPDPDLALM